MKQPGRRAATSSERSKASRLRAKGDRATKADRLWLSRYERSRATFAKKKTTKVKRRVLKKPGEIARMLARAIHSSMTGEVSNPPLTVSWERRSTSRRPGRIVAAWPDRNLGDKPSNPIVSSEGREPGEQIFNSQILADEVRPFAQRFGVAITVLCGNQSTTGRGNKAPPFWQSVLAYTPFGPTFTADLWKRLEDLARGTDSRTGEIYAVSIRVTPWREKRIK